MMQSYTRRVFIKVPFGRKAAIIGKRSQKIGESVTWKILRHALYN